MMAGQQRRMDWSWSAHPIAWAIAVGLVFGAIVIHASAALVASLTGDTSVVQGIGQAYAPASAGILVYHAALGGLGGIFAGLAIRRQIMHQNAVRERDLKIERGQRLESVANVAAGIAHDMNNLLTALSMRIHIAAKHAEAPEAIEHLERAKAVAAKAEALPRQVLAFARRERAEPRLYDPARLVEETTQFMDRVLGDDIVMEVDAPHVGLVHGDPGQYEQVLVNLLVNARDAMPQGGVLRVRLRRSPDPTMVVLTVADSGTGISKEVQERLFEPFYTTKPEGQGTGLGLATCMTIVEQHGGTIDVDSTLGEGTTFRVALPWASDAPEPSPAGRTPLAEEGHEGTVLVVDDEQEIVAAICASLESYGFKVVGATDPTAALACLDDAAVDVALLDVRMPQLSGPALAERLASVQAGIPVILMSGSPYDAGSLPLVRKPLDAESLIRLLDERVAASRS